MWPDHSLPDAVRVMDALNRAAVVLDTVAPRPDRAQEETARTFLPLPWLRMVRHIMDSLEPQRLHHLHTRVARLLIRGLAVAEHR